MWGSLELELACEVTDSDSEVVGNTSAVSCHVLFEYARFKIDMFEIHSRSRPTDAQMLMYVYVYSKLLD